MSKILYKIYAICEDANRERYTEYCDMELVGDTCVRRDLTIPSEVLEYMNKHICIGDDSVGVLLDTNEIAASDKHSSIVDSSDETTNSRTLTIELEALGSDITSLHIKMFPEIQMLTSSLAMPKIDLRGIELGFNKFPMDSRIGYPGCKKRPSLDDIKCGSDDILDNSLNLTKP